MNYIVIWFGSIRMEIAHHYGAFGPFETAKAAEQFAAEHDPFYPHGAMYKVIALLPRDYVRNK